MKRKADSAGLDTELSEEGNVRLKALRRSVSEFIAENENIGTSKLGRRSLGIDAKDEAWIKYRERLTTFPVTSMLKKPKELSPTICAKHGWRFSDEEFLQCDECNKVLCTTLPSRATTSARLWNLFTKNIVRKLTEAHDTACLWRANRGLNVMLPYNIHERYELLKQSSLNTVPLASNIIGKKWTDQFDLDDEFCLITAICGWMPLQKNDPNRIECLLCGRNLSLLVFSDENKLNLLEQHYTYCPVIDKEFPLWQISVERYPIRQKNQGPVSANLSRMKHMLSTWFS
jgi:hypothetical protein